MRRQSRRSAAVPSFVSEALECRRLLAAGDFDVSFDGDGRASVVASFVSHDVAVQSDGKTVVVGIRSSRAVLQRFNVDGSVDTTFGDQGVATVNGMGIANAVAIQTDGKIVITGAPVSGFLSGPFALDQNRAGMSIARLNTNGSLDKTFDGDGISSTIESTLDTFGAGLDIAVEPDYTPGDGIYNPKYVVVGSVEDDELVTFNDDILVARWTSTGSLDSSFDGDGRKYLAFGKDEYGTAIAIDTSGSVDTNPYYGSILVAGVKEQTATDVRAAVVRLKRDGGYDNSFDGDGKISHQFVGYTSFVPYAILPQAGGKVVIAGRAGGNAATGNDFGLMRLSSNGKLDPTFGTTGTGRLARNLGGDDWARDVIVGANGGLIVGGTSAGSMALVMLTADGQTDTSFFAGAGSRVVTGTPGIAGLDKGVSSKRFVAAGGGTVLRVLEAGANVVYVSTLFDSTMSEAGLDPVGFYVYRTERLGVSTRVFLTATGTARAIGTSPGTGPADYTGFSNSPIYNFVDIPANETFVFVLLTPIDDATAEGTETVVMSILRSDNYEIGAPSSTTMTILDNDANTLRATADATVRGGTFANTNFGGQATLEVKNNSNAEYTRQVFLKFDLSGVTTINSASLRLFGSLNNTNATNLGVSVYSASNTSWSETGITWNNRPTTGASALATATVIDTIPRWYSWNLTSYLQAEKAAGRNVVTLVLKATAVTDPFALFNSDEAATNKPQLVLG